MMGIFQEQGRGGLHSSGKEAARWYSPLGSPETVEKIRKEIESLRKSIREENSFEAVQRAS